MQYASKIINVSCGHLWSVILCQLVLLIRYWARLLRTPGFRKPAVWASDWELCRFFSIRCLRADELHLVQNCWTGGPANAVEGDATNIIPNANGCSFCFFYVQVVRMKGRRKESGRLRPVCCGWCMYSQADLEFNAWIQRMSSIHTRACLFLRCLCVCVMQRNVIYDNT